MFESVCSASAFVNALGNEHRMLILCILAEGGRPVRELEVCWILDNRRCYNSLLNCGLTNWLRSAANPERFIIHSPVPKRSRSLPSSPSCFAHRRPKPGKSISPEAAPQGLAAHANLLAIETYDGVAFLPSEHVALYALRPDLPLPKIKSRRRNGADLRALGRSLMSSRPKLPRSSPLHCCHVPTLHPGPPVGSPAHPLCRSLAGRDPRPDHRHGLDDRR
jgi:hypothetical protein